MEQGSGGALELNQSWLVLGFKARLQLFVQIVYIFIFVSIFVIFVIFKRLTRLLDRLLEYFF